MDGRVLIVGGEGGPDALGNPAQLASNELFDPATETWTATASMVAARGREFTATRLADGRVLVAAGVGADGWLTSAELFDPGSP